MSIDHAALNSFPTPRNLTVLRSLAGKNTNISYLLYLLLRFRCNSQSTLFGDSLHGSCEITKLFWQMLTEKISYFKFNILSLKLGNLDDYVETVSLVLG